MKWVYLKNNSLGLDTVAYKGYEDPLEILNFIRDNINPSKLYKQRCWRKK